MKKAALSWFMTCLGCLGISVAQAQTLTLSLASEVAGGSIRPVTATPLDPTSNAQDSFFENQRFSSRRLAIDIVVNGLRAHGQASDRFGRPLFDRPPERSRWRIRASLNRVMVRYEIIF